MVNSSVEPIEASTGAPTMPENPFPGLRAFEAAETHLFFGREGQSDEILRILGQHRFVAVVGTSGSGKSSLVRAGMIPSLEAGYMTGGGTSWRFAVMRPGEESDPIASLAHRLADPVVFPDSQVGSEAMTRIFDSTLRRSSFGLIEAAKQQRLKPGENLMVLVDQFEELFRLRAGRVRHATEDVEAAFVRLLLEATRQTELPIYVVITMRSDFIGDCAEFRDLPEALNRAQYLIPRMTRDQRREAIEGPIAVSGATISPRLVQRLLNEVGDNPDQLPILQHALMRTWAAWQGKGKPDQPIDIEHYESIGGWENALSRHADEAFNELDPHQQAVAARIFKALVERTAENRETRRPQQVSALAAIADADERTVTGAIDHFRIPGRTFLMPPAPTPLRSDSIVDISHESLIRLWKRLRDWVSEEAESAIVYRRLADAARRHNRRQGDLWRELDLKSGLEWQAATRPNAAWASRYAPQFEDAIKFLELSRLDQERESAERERVRRERRTFVRVLEFALVLLVALLIVVVRQRETAKRERDQAHKLALEASLEKQSAEARELRIRAEQAKGSSPEVSSLLAIESARMMLRRDQYTVSSDGILREGLRILKPDGVYPAPSDRERCHGKEITAPTRARISRIRFNQAGDRVDFSPDGQSFAAVCEGGGGSSDGGATAAAIIATGRAGQPIPLADSSNISTVAFSPDASMVAGSGEDGRVNLFDAKTGRARWRDPVRLDSPVESLSFSRTGRFIAAGFGKIIFASGSAASDAEQSGSVGGLKILNATDGSVRVSPPITGAVVDADFSADGRLVAVADWNGEGILFDAESGQELIPRVRKTFSTPDGRQGQYNCTSVGFSLDGSYVAFGFGSPDVHGAGLVVVYDTKSMAQVGHDRNVSGEVAAIRFSPPQKSDRPTTPSFAVLSRQNLWIEDYDEATQSWNPRRENSIQNAGAGTMYSDATFSPDGKYLITADTGGFLYFYDPWLLEPVTYRRVVDLGQLIGLKLSPNGDQLAAIGTERTEIFDVHHKLLASRSVLLRGASPTAKGIATFSRDFSIAVAPDEAGNEWIFQLDNGDQYQARKLDPEVPDHSPIAAVAIQGQGRLTAFCNGHELVVEETKSGDRLWEAGGNCQSLAFTPDGQWLAVASRASSGDSRVQVLRVSDHSPGWTSPVMSRTMVSATAFDPSGHLLAIATTTGLYIGAVESGDFARVNNIGAATALAFSSNGQRLAVADEKGRVFLLKTATRAADFAIEADFSIAPTSKVENLEFSPDGRFLMAHAANNMMLHLFDLTHKNREISNFNGFNGVFAAGFDQSFVKDPKMFLAISNPDSISVLRSNSRAYVAPASIIAEICGSLSRNLDCDEWRDNFPDEPYHPICENLPSPKCR